MPNPPLCAGYKASTSGYNNNPRVKVHIKTLFSLSIRTRNIITVLNFEVQINNVKNKNKILDGAHLYNSKCILQLK